MGRGRGSRARPTHCCPSWPPCRCEAVLTLHPSAIRQQWRGPHCQQGPLPLSRYQQRVEAHLPRTRARWYPPPCRTRGQSGQHFRLPLPWSCPYIPSKLPSSHRAQHLLAATRPPESTHLLVSPAHGFRLLPPAAAGGPAVREDVGQLHILPSPLRPPVPAEDRIFAWRGVNSPPPSTISHPLVTHLADIASRASLREGTLAGYGSGLRKFHLFCDIFSIPEALRLPASYELLHSFCLWSVADPSDTDVALAGPIPFEPISVTAAAKYLDAVRAWHLAQGWQPPISEDDRKRINWSLRGLANLQLGRRRRPPRPPVTLHMLADLKQTLRLTDPFEACIWAIAACAFWGLMRFGEATVRSRSQFRPTHNLKRSDAFFGWDLDGKEYARLDLPTAKTARPGEIQHIFLVRQDSLCPIDAIRNLASVVPALASDPLFSWRDNLGDIRPMVRDTALSFINGRFTSLGYGTTFGHSFRIGGASFYLSQKVDPEVVRIMGRWRSLAYQVYIRAFEQVASRHTAHLPSNYGL
ncbi:DNA breaking-rejoining enzyme [Trametes coccinea BRFM310]|uniref:DNA breaking-rejoining enzyme n=1 Tax=Trametes coccinea (strain BRFM310) TaxID=1353009 RepID=A0A1Y2IZ73_TRAC3|nr:DNA breaking-rejoining enzyme [Trametes coccinea BRFM310]